MREPFPRREESSVTGKSSTWRSDGKLFLQECLEVAKTRGEGWTEYMYPTPGKSKKPTPWKEKKSTNTEWK